MTTARIREERSLPDGIGRLAEAGRAEGFSFVDRLILDWETGANRFDAPGERFLCAYQGDALVGCGGLNRDPYSDDPSVGRIRHVYVLPAARGSGAGGAMVRELIRSAPPGFRRLRLRTRRAGRFYEHLGFEAVEEHAATHVLVWRTG